MSQLGKIHKALQRWTLQKRFSWRMFQNGARLPHTLAARPNSILTQKKPPAGQHYRRLLKESCGFPLSEDSRHLRQQSWIHSLKADFCGSKSCDRAISNKANSPTIILWLASYAPAKCPFSFSLLILPSSSCMPVSCDCHPRKPGDDHVRQFHLPVQPPYVPND